MSPSGFDISAGNTLKSSAKRYNAYKPIPEGRISTMPMDVQHHE
jgi:hypothetical protein